MIMPNLKSVSIANLQNLSLSVIIPVHNGGEKFRKCLDSLGQTEMIPEEIIVVVDGGTTNGGMDDVSIITQHPISQQAGVKVIKLPVCKGPGTARNIGAQKATGDILFFTDADVTINPDTIEKVKNVFVSNPHLSAMIGSYDDAPGEANFLSQYKNLFHHYTHQIAREEASTFWGACGAIRRHVFLSVGGFAPSYRRPTIEDIELGYRLRKRGHQIQLCKDVQVKHWKRWTFVSLLKAEFFYRALPWVELIWRDRTVKNDLNVGYVSRLSVVLVYTLLAAMFAAIWISPSMFLGVGCAALLLGFNLPVYRFFADKRGFWFTLQVIPWHWFYYFYCGLAFVVGTIRYFVNQLVSVPKPQVSKI